MLLYKFYNFYEKSVQGEKIVVDNDISGEQYKDLMKTCCKYCKILSLKYRKNVFNTTREKLKKFESVNGPLGRPFIEYYSRGEEIVFYDENKKRLTYFDTEIVGFSHIVKMAKKGSIKEIK